MLEYSPIILDTIQSLSGVVAYGASEPPGPEPTNSCREQRRKPRHHADSRGPQAPGAHPFRPVSENVTMGLLRQLSSSGLIGPRRIRAAAQRITEPPAGDTHAGRRARGRGHHRVRRGLRRLRAGLTRPYLRQRQQPARRGPGPGPGRHPGDRRGDGDPDRRGGPVGGSACRPGRDRRGLAERQVGPAGAGRDHRDADRGVARGACGAASPSPSCACPRSSSRL